MNDQTLKNRLRQIRDGVSRLKLDCLIVAKPPNVTYLTGFTGDDSWVIVLPASPDERTSRGGPKGVILVTDSRFTEQAAAQCRLCRIVSRRDAMIKTVARLLQKQGGKTLAVEKSMSVADFQELNKQLKGRLKSISLIVESARREKDQGEVAAISAAAEIAARAFQQTRRLIRPGLSENELAGIVDFQIRKLGGKNSFETIVAFGANASIPHHQPTNRKLSKNDTVLIDFGVRYNGYCCDLTRCFETGRPVPFFRKVYSVVEQAQAAALKIIRADAKIIAVDAAAKRVIKKSGLPVYGHGTGHGLGLEVHELPIVSNRTKGALQTGDVITVEPAVYIPGKLGVRIEDDVLVTDDGYLALSDGPKLPKSRS
ncbi:MAG: Xaa-Pro peptidase family protein [Planctomycetota bacterium]